MGANGVTSGGSPQIRKPPGRSLLLPGVYRTLPKPYQATLQPPAATLPLPGTPHPQSTIQEGTPDTSARPTISPVSLPPSLAQPTAGDGRGEEGRSRADTGKDKGGVGGCKWS